MNNLLLFLIPTPIPALIFIVKAVNSQMGIKGEVPWLVWLSGLSAGL